MGLNYIETTQRKILKLEHFKKSLQNYKQKSLDINKKSEGNKKKFSAKMLGLYHFMIDKYGKVDL